MISVQYWNVAINIFKKNISLFKCLTSTTSKKKKDAIIEKIISHQGKWIRDFNLALNLELMLH